MPKEHVHVESLFPEDGMAVAGFCSRVVWSTLPLFAFPGAVPFDVYATNWPGL